MGHMKNFDIRIRNGGDDAIAAVSELMAGRWIPVGERLPECDDEVLVCCRGRSGLWCRWTGYLSDAADDGIQRWRASDKNYRDLAPTHWQPLPEPPAT